MDPTDHKPAPTAHPMIIPWTYYFDGDGYGNGLFAMPSGDADYRPPYNRYVLLTTRHLVHVIDYAHLRGAYD